MFGAVTNITDQINALDASWSTLAVDMNSCAPFASTQPEGAAFDTDLHAWKQFVANPPLTGAQTELNTWQTKLSEWQGKVRAAGCQVSGLTVTPPSTTNPPLVGPGGTVLDTTSTAGMITTVLLVGVGAFLTYKVVTAYLPSKRSSSRGTREQYFRVRPDGRQWIVVDTWGTLVAGPFDTRSEADSYIRRAGGRHHQQRLSRTWR